MNLQKLLPIGKYVLGTIIGALILWGVICLAIGNPKDYIKTKAENKELQVKIDSIQKNQLLLNKKLDSIFYSQQHLQNLIDINNDLIGTNSIQLQKIQNNYHEKINGIDKYNVDQLDSFISKRYGQ